MPENIQQIISQKFPGVVLDSPVQGWWYLDQYQKGIEEYHKLKCASAEDDRWIGACYFLSGNDLTASKYFSQAIRRRSKTAHINLAHCHMFTNQRDEVTAQLSNVDTESLNAFDRAYYFKVMSYYEQTNTNLTQALNNAEIAHAIVQTIPESTLLTPRFLKAIGMIYGHMGN